MSAPELRPASPPSHFDLRALSERMRTGRSAPALTPEESLHAREQAAEIVRFAISDPHAVRFVPSSNGHLATYALGEERRDDAERGLPVDVLTVSITTTERFGPQGKLRVEAKLLIDPYNPPKISAELIDGGARTTSVDPASAKDVEDINNALQGGSSTDPRSRSWKTLAQPLT